MKPGEEINRMVAEQKMTAENRTAAENRTEPEHWTTRRRRIRPRHPAAWMIRGCLALPWLLAPFLPGAADALPRYSARYGQSCILCHHNPTGGGLRSLYASQYLVPAEIAGRAYEPDELARFNPSLTPNIFAGVDLRNVLSEGEGDHGWSGNIAMQADLYLGLQMDERFAAYLDLGQSRTHEYFGLAHVLPANGYIKVGRFTPAYGWRFADHQLAGRRYLLLPEGTDFASTLHDAGIEFALSPGDLDLTAALMGGGGENGDSYAARGVWRRAFGPLQLAAGGSHLRRQESSTDRRATGLFGYVAGGALAWIWELDETRLAGDGEPPVDGFLVSQEVAWLLRRGLDLRVTYSFQDPDRELRTGSRTRWGAGIDALPYPFFGWQLMLNSYLFEQGERISAEDYLQAELVIHFLY